MTFLIILVVTEVLCSFRLVIEEETGKEKPESSRLGLLLKCIGFLIVALSYAEHNNTRPLNRLGYRSLTFV